MNLVSVVFVGASFFFLFFFFTSHCSNSLSLFTWHSLNSVGVQERNKGSLRLFTMTTWSEIPRIPEILLSLQIGIHSDSSNRSFDPEIVHGTRVHSSKKIIISLQLHHGRPTSWNVVFRICFSRGRSEWRVRRS